MLRRILFAVIIVLLLLSLLAACAPARPQPCKLLPDQSLVSASDAQGAVEISLGGRHVQGDLEIIVDGVQFACDENASPMCVAEQANVRIWNVRAGQEIGSFALSPGDQVSCGGTTLRLLSVAFGPVSMSVKP